MDSIDEIIENEINTRLESKGFTPDQIEILKTRIYDIADENSYAIPKINTIESILKTIENFTDERVIN